ncbi:MAG: hypothetical protein GY711_34370 [bacterium]|nr:hypothetical protein [bacterium]
MRREGLACALLVLASVGCSSTRDHDHTVRDGASQEHGLLPLVYAEDFDTAASLEAFTFTDANAWRWHDSGALELAASSEYEPPHRSPRSIAWIEDLTVGDFVLDATLVQTGREYGHRDLCLFFGYTSPARYYYVHLATTPDQNANNVFLVADAPRTNLAPVPESGVEWGTDQPHRVRVERRLGEGTIRVFFDDMETPVLEASDTTHGAGRVGFGSFDDTGRFDEIRIWAQ